jgi:hypothetical protein
VLYIRYNTHHQKVAIKKKMGSTGLKVAFDQRCMIRVVELNIEY